MRARSFALVAGLLATGLFATETWSSMSEFDIKGTWAANGQSCSDADLFVRFDGREIVGLQGSDTKATLADTYSTAFDDGRLVIELTNPSSHDRDEWKFLVDGRDMIRLDNTFLATQRSDRSGPVLMTFRRCPTAT